MDEWTRAADIATTHPAQVGSGSLANQQERQNGHHTRHRRTWYGSVAWHVTDGWCG